MNKYRNKKVVIDGEKFDSQKEGRRYQELKQLLNAGDISELRLQPTFLIAEGGMKDPATGRRMANRVYKADFSYIDTKTGKHIVEDVKSVITAKNPLFRLKRHLFLFHYGKDCTFLET